MTMHVFDHHEGAHNELQRVFAAPEGHHHHKAKLSHELIAAAASYEAAKMYNEHVAKNGTPPSHAQAKQIMAAAAGFFIDRMIETKGLDFLDRQKAKHHAKEHVEASFTEEAYNNHRHGHQHVEPHYIEERYDSDSHHRDHYRRHHCHRRHCHHCHHRD